MPCAELSEALDELEHPSEVLELELVDVEPPIFARRGRRYRVALDSERRSPRAVSCAGDKQEAPLRWHLCHITQTEELQHV